MLKIVFFEIEPWEKTYLQERIIGHEVEFYEESINHVESSTIYDAEILCVFISSVFTKDVLDKFPNLKLIACMSTGYDHVDLDECNRRGIVVCNVPAYGDNTVAEHAFGLILNLARNIHKAYIRTRHEEFSYQGLMGMDLQGKTLGVLGTGKIGQHAMRIAKGFGMNIIAYDAYPKDGLDVELGFRYVSFNELLRESDVITIHVPLTQETFHLIDNDAISRMKDGVLIVNTARGAIIDTEALIQGLNSGKIGGAGLDVLEGELLIKEERELTHAISTLPKAQLELLLQDHALMKMPNVIVTPHLAFYSKEALLKILDTTLKNVFDLIENRGFENRVS